MENGSETDKASPASLCENEAPTTDPDCLKPPNGTTLGQTLKDELRRSSKRVILEKTQKDPTPKMTFAEEMYSSTNETTPLGTPGTPSSDVDTNNGRRRRPRRNPVWQHFTVDDGIAKCKQCEYSTKSVFSTNLKVHLKSHHRELHQQVIEAEELMAIATSTNTTVWRSIKEGTSAVPRRQNTHLSAVDEQRYQELKQRLTAQANSEMKDNLCNSLPFALNNETSIKTLNDLLASHSTAHMLTTNKQQKLTPFSATIRQEPLPVDVPQMSVPQMISQSSSLDPMDRTKQKRKRLRRHPVWQYFCDVDEKVVGCVMCSFRTVSAFSTNLKMHLKAHHKQEYLHVMELELEQRQDEESSAVGMEEGQTSEGSANAGSRYKRRRKTVEELQGIIDKCKNNMQKDKCRRSSIASSSSAMASTAVGSNGVAFDPEKMAGMSATEQLEAMVGFMCSDPAVSDLFNGNTFSLDASDYGEDSTDTTSAVDASDPLLPTSFGDIEEGKKSFRDMLSQLRDDATEKTVQSIKKHTQESIKKHTQENSLAKLVQRVGSVELFLTEEFRNFVSSLAPDFAFPQVDDLYAMLNT